MNLTLKATYFLKRRSLKIVEVCQLFQTPTKITEQALANNAVKAKDVYFRWLRQTYVEDLSTIKSSQQLVNSFLRKHRGHTKWGM